MAQGFPLITERLLLRPLDPTDAEQLYQLNLAPEVMRYVPDEPFTSIAQSRSFLEDYTKVHPSERRRCAVIRRSDQEWLGWCGLKYDQETEETDLGFRFHQPYWGMGYATEAAKKVLAYGFEHQGLVEIVGRTAFGNLASQRVLEKCGFRPVGTFENADWSGLVYKWHK